MSRVEIELLAAGLDAAYRDDPWSALLTNLASVADEEWDMRPAEYSVEVFGTEPELSIGEIVLHIAGPLVMYGNRAFEDGTMTWERVAGQAPGPGRSRTMAWLDEAYGNFLAGLKALADDGALDAMRVAHWGEQLPVRQFVGLMTNHMIYHAGEINRQRSLIRGASGWDR